MPYFSEVLTTRRSIRKFTDTEVPDDILQKVIEDACCAPSSGNEQPWKFIVVKDRPLMNRISADAKESLLARIEANPDDYARKYEKMLQSETFNIFYNAPVLVYIIGDRSLKNTVINCTLAAGNFMLSAAARGLGTCWINFATAVTSEELLHTLGITREDTIVAPIIVGYPEKMPAMPARKEPRVTFIS